MTSVSFSRSLVLLEVIWKSWINAFFRGLPPDIRRYLSINEWFVIGDLRSVDAISPEDQRPVAAAIPEEEVLVRRIDLPLVSSFQLSSLMKYEAPRYIPLPLHIARIDFRVISRDFQTSKMRVDLAVLRGDVVERVLRDARNFGLAPEAVALPIDSGVWIARRPLAQKWWQPWLSRRRLRQYLKILVPALLIFLWIFAIQIWTARLAKSRDDAVFLAQIQAANVNPARQNLISLEDSLSYLNGLRNRPSAADVVEEVARLLPDNAWLQELDVEDQTVELRGTASHASDLLRILSSSSMFSNVQFAAPLTQTMGSDDQQFDITMARN